MTGGAMLLVLVVEAALCIVYAALLARRHNRLDRRRAGRRQAWGDFRPAEVRYFEFQYRRNPADLDCPRGCRAGVEVAGFHDPDAWARGETRPKDPEEPYTVVVCCHGCQGWADFEIGRRGGERRRMAGKS